MFNTYPAISVSSDSAYLALITISVTGSHKNVKLSTAISQSR